MATRFNFLDRGLTATGNASRSMKTTIIDPEFQIGKERTYSKHAFTLANVSLASAIVGARMYHLIKVKKTF